MAAAIVTAILSAIGAALGYQLVGDVSSTLGAEGSKKWRSTITEISNLISKNSQLLSDWKTANENKKAGIINSLISSSGIGSRAKTLKAMYDKAMSQDKEKTSEAQQKQSELNNLMSEAEHGYNKAASGGLVSAVKEWFGGNDQPTSDLKTRAKQVADSATGSLQNINGGLNSGGK